MPNFVVRSCADFMSYGSVAWSAEKSVLIVYEPDAEASRQSLSEELEAMEISTRSRGGTGADAEEAVQAEQESAVVFLTSERALIWVSSDDNVSSGEAEAPVIVVRNPGESSETEALRIAEHLRGSLLPGGRPTDQSGDYPSRGFGRDDIFSVSTGPQLVLRSDAKPSLAWSLDAAFWFGRFGIGAFIRTSLTASDWRLEPKKMILRETVGGIAARLVLFEPSPSWQTQLLLRAGWNASALQEEKAKPKDPKGGTVGYLASEIGIESTYAVTNWLSLGAQVLGGLDAAVSWSPRTPDGPMGPMTPVPPDPGIQSHFVFGAIASARF